jgi:uncharacterized phage protein (TIGR01671 family)
MRELKFRSFYKPTKKMFWFDVMDGNHGRGNGYIGMTPFGEGQDAHGNHRGNMILVDPNDCEIMQFTGLHDKNGIPVYEGDILSKDPFLKVVFENGGFCFSNDLLSGSDRLSQDRVGRLEIIGNIHSEL